MKIAHLYYDLMNLHGEQGNIMALKKSFAQQKIDLEVDLLSIGDNIDFKAYDLFYIGMGSEENLILVLEDIKKYHKDIKDTIKNKQYFIATGNAYELFGKSIEINNKEHQALNIFNYTSKESPKRIVGECLMTFKDLKPIIGFKNHGNIVDNENNHLFEALKENSFEGYYEDNFFGTHLIGPLLIRNPHFTEYIVKDILKDNYQIPDQDYQDQAYEEYIKNFYE